MIKSGIIHAELAAQLAGLRHTETFVICDAGLPLGTVPTVDLGYRYGSPTFADILETVLPEVVIQDSWVSDPIAELNPATVEAIRAAGLQPNSIAHNDFKERVLQAKFAIRTGEATLYANVLLQAGAAF